MITYIYDGCFYCGRSVPVDDDYTSEDTVFCSPVCMVQRVVYDMLVAYQNGEVEDDED